MNMFPGHIRHRNRPGIGVWYLRQAEPTVDMYYQLSHPSCRTWQMDPIFKSGDAIIIVGFEPYIQERYKSTGWLVSALDGSLKGFEFFWSDEVAWRGVWQR